MIHSQPPVQAKSHAQLHAPSLRPRFYRLTKPIAQMPQTRALALISAGALALTCIAMLVVQRRQRIVHLGYELAQLTKQRDALAEEIRSLQLDRAVLAAPDRIRRLAAELGMQAPLPTEVSVVPYLGPALDIGPSPATVAAPAEFAEPAASSLELTAFAAQETP